MVTSSYILHHPGRPFFRHEPQDVVVTVGDTAMLQCAGTGSPPPVLTWWRVNYGGEPELVTSDNRVIVRYV